VTTLDRELRRELAAAFAADAPARLEELAAALERLVGGAAGARDDAARQAHALRGAAATVGDQALAGLCASIEELLAEEPADLEEVAAALRLVERERDRLGASRGAPAPAAGRRPLPSSFAGRVAVLAAVAIVPALGIAVYDAVHGRSSARAQAQAELRRDVNLVAGAERQALDGAAVVLGLAAGAEEARHAPSPACDRLLASVARGPVQFARLAVVDARGRALCGAPLAARGEAVGTEAAAAARATGRLAVGGLERRPGGGFGVPLAQPVRAPAGAATAVVGEIDVALLERLLGSGPLRAGAALTLLDADGRVLARRPDAARWVGKGAGAGLRAALEEGGGLAEVRGIDGVRRVYGFEPVGPWEVAVGVPAGEAYASVDAQLRRNLAIAALLGLAGLAAALWLARVTLQRPLRALVDTTRRLGAGDLAARTGLSARDGELGELGEAVDSMAASLERRTVDRERSAAELGRLAGDLERRVEERTARLAEARAEAERANAAKTAFLSRLSHELRTPLNAVRGFSRLLATGGNLPPYELEAARHLSSAAEHMTALVEELLDTARIEAGQLRVEVGSVGLAAVVGDVLELARTLAADYGVTLEEPRLEPGLLVAADASRLKQALLNLVTNAVRYNRRGGSVVVRARRAGGRRVHVEVEDTGQGVAPEDLERLFVPYDRLGREAEPGGLGLGLSLTRRIVEAMGGRIAVESEPGSGTCFRVELAAADAELPSRPRRRSGTARVLYVEDSATSRKLVELMLRGRGVELVGAGTAAEGVRLARALLPDLVLLDLELPDGSGEGVLRQLRSDETLRATPVVALSGDGARETVRRILEAGADDYLTKPLELDRAAAVLDRFLSS